MSAELHGASLGICKAFARRRLRRFEQTGSVAFDSLVRICIALGCTDDLEGLFSKRAYRNIQEVIDAQRA